MSKFRLKTIVYDHEFWNKLNGTGAYFTVCSISAPFQSRWGSWLFPHSTRIIQKSDHVSYGGPLPMFRSIYRSISRPTLNQVSVEHRPCSGRCSVDISLEYRPIYRSTLLPVDIVGVHRNFTDTSPMLHQVHRSIYRSRHRSKYRSGHRSIYLLIYRSIVFIR